MDNHGGGPSPSAPDPPQVERSIVLETPPETLWRHLVDGSLASLWMGGEMTIEPKLNGKVRLLTADAPVIFGTVEEIAPGESITWTWRTSDGEPTQVTIRLEAAEQVSRLTVIERLIPYEIVVIPPVLG
jgi:uncharacterized protein YndB with AHSA1/START domain